MQPAFFVFSMTCLPVCHEGPGKGPSRTDTKTMQGFSWILEKQLAGMPRPGTAGSLDDDLVFLASQKLDLLVSLTEIPIESQRLKSKGIKSLHLPVPDFTAPSIKQLQRFVAVSNAIIKNNGRVGVHCAGGKGRTGTFLAAYLVYTGLKPEKAIAQIRKKRPGSIETSSQEETIRAFHLSIQSATPYVLPPKVKRKD
jgi:atypical dual specificity phosphatase